MSDQHLSHLMKLIEVNQVYGSYSYLKSLPLDVSIPNRQKLLAEMEEKVLKAKTLVKQVDHLLEKGEYPRALNYLKSAKDIVPDYPKINTDIKFIQATMDDIKGNLDAAEKAARHGDQGKVAALLKEVAKIDRGNKDIAGIKAHLAKGQRLKKVKKISLIALALLLPLIYLCFESYSLDKAQSHWSKATALLARQDYQGSQESINAALAKLRRVRLISQEKKGKLTKWIMDMQFSTTFQQGLEGKVINNGFYQPEEAQVQKERIAYLEKEARGQARKKEFTKAIVTYNEALSIARLDVELHHATIDRLQQSIDSFKLQQRNDRVQADLNQFQLLITQADTLLAEEKWPEAKLAYSGVHEFALNKGLDLPALLVKAEQGRDIAAIQIVLAQARSLEKEGADIVAIISSYDKAMTMASKADLSGHPFLAASRNHLAQLAKTTGLSRFKLLEAQGDELASSKLFVEAVGKYEKALELLNNKQGMGSAQPDDKLRLRSKVEQCKRLELAAAAKDDQVKAGSGDALAHDNQLIRQSDQLHG
ncbi:MAG: hypothetical protein ABFR97_05475 [Thermodesulfobacteriota bacterium]